MFSVSPVESTSRISSSFALLSRRRTQSVASNIVSHSAPSIKHYAHIAKPPEKPLERQPRYFSIPDETRRAISHSGDVADRRSLVLHTRNFHCQDNSEDNVFPLTLAHSRTRASRFGWRQIFLHQDDNRAGRRDSGRIAVPSREESRTREITERCVSPWYYAT